MPVNYNARASLELSQSSCLAGIWANNFGPSYIEIRVPTADHGSGLEAALQIVVANLRAHR
jgi:hypothetical protein